MERNVETQKRAAVVWQQPRLSFEKLWQGFGVNKSGWKMRLKDELRWGREAEEIWADEGMRAAKPGCSSSQLKTQTHTLEHMDIIPKNTLIFYLLDTLNDLYPPDFMCCVLTSHLYSRGRISPHSEELLRQFPAQSSASTCHCGGLNQIDLLASYQM